MAYGTIWGWRGGLVQARMNVPGRCVVGRIPQLCLLGLIGLAISGCGNLIELPGSGPAPRIYDLSVSDGQFAGEYAEGGWRLHVDEPDAPRALDTDKVVLRSSGVELQYYKDARWSDRAPKLVQSMLVDVLDGSGAAALVSGDATIARSRYALKGYLRSFEAQYAGGGDPLVVIRLKLVLADQLSGKLMSVRSFEQSAQARADNMTAIVNAMNEAAGNLVAEVRPWVVSVMDAAHEEDKARRASSAQSSANEEGLNGSDADLEEDAVSTIGNNSEDG